MRSPGVNVSVAYAWWPVFRCRSMAGFGCLPRPGADETAPHERSSLPPALLAVAEWRPSGAGAICSGTICPGMVGTRAICSPALCIDGPLAALTAGATVLSGEAFLTTPDIAFALVPLERLPGVSVLATRTPVAPARCAHLFGGRSRGFRRFPQLPALKPFHLGVRMALLQPTECRKKVIAFSRAERGR